MAKRPAKYCVQREPVVQPHDQSIKIIALTRGKTTVVDATDYERLMIKNWVALWDDHTKCFYARGTHGGTGMHRYILGITDPNVQVDHWDGDTLNNRRINLRVTNQNGNRQNRGVYKNTNSGHAGVSWRERDQVWIVYINTNGKRTYLGQYKEDDKQKAIDRRVEAEREQHGEFAFANRHKITTCPR